MAYTTVKALMTAIADKIRAKLKTTGKISSQDIPDAIDEACTQTYNEGKQAEYDAFWDSFQDNGKRTAYNYGFSGRGWNDQTFKPKYNIKPDWSGVGVFMFSSITDLEARLNECGVTLNLDGNPNLASVFENSTVTVIPTVTITGSATFLSNTFKDCKSLHTIRKIVLKEGFNIVMDSTFTNCTALENVVFDGIIPKNINMQWCTKLTHDSLTNLINALSTTATGQTVTLSATAVNNAFDGGSEGDEWLNLIATKNNWTISLV